MFGKIISREGSDESFVKLLTPDADALFNQQIIQVRQAPGPLFDDSLLATSRALVYPRLRGDEVFYVGYETAHKPLEPWFYVTEDIEDISRPSLELRIIGTDLESVDFFSKTEFGAWTKIEKITDFFKKSFKTVCYIHEGIRRAVIYADIIKTSMDYRESLRRFHYIQCSIVAALPWIFSPNEGITELEMQVIKGLTERTETSYITALNQIAEHYDFKNLKIKRLLGGFEQMRNKAHLEEVERMIEQYTKRIESFNEQISQYISELNALNIRRLGLICDIKNKKDKDGQIAEYFMCNKSLVLLEAGKDTIKFGVKTYLEYYDEENVRAILNNPASFVYKNIPSDEDIKILLEAIFIEQKLKLRVCATYELSLGGNVSGKTSDFAEPEFRDEAGELVYMPNAHIQEYHCLGTYSIPINKCIADGDYIGAIEQCVASAQSLNFNDPSAGIFVEALRGETRRNMIFSNKCIELPDGSVVRPKEAIKYLKESAENE